MARRWRIKYLGLGTLACASGSASLAGHVAAAIIGALIVRRRGVYFAMVTIAFGQVFYFIAFRWNSVTGGDDGLNGWHRLPIDFGFAKLDIFGNDKAFYYFVLVVLRALRRRRWRVLLRLAVRPHAGRHPRERAARALSRHPGRTAHLAVVRDLLLLRQPRRRALRARSTISPTRARCASISPAISSSWRCSAACARSGGR